MALSVSPPPGPRLESVDLLRGLVMVLMALDHVRDFFTNAQFDPLDLTKTTPALFATRWITHFCAPVFTFLAGTGAYLAWTRGKTKGELSWFLFSRGLWLALLEVTWVRCLGWEFNFNFHSIGVGTLWSIGWSMVALSALVFLPTWAVTCFGVAMIAGHNALDWVKPEALGSFGWLWNVLHVSDSFQIAPGFRFAVGYPLVPWIGVVATGYGFGSLLLLEPAERRKWILRIGVALALLFIALRFSNLYGNSIYASSRQWSVQRDWLYTIFSFIDCHKYPPSLLYLLMTLGPALIVLSFLDRGTPRVLRPFLVFGRVPLFYYLLHLPLIHALAVVAAYARFGHAEWLFISPFQPATPPPDNGFGLPIVYVVWISVVLVLYPVCRWFAEVKRRRRDAWLSYL
jgi:uncharacterized membrane protein